MKRRALLASLTAGVAGLAGCNGLGGERTTPERDPYDVPATPTTVGGTTVEEESFVGAVAPGRPGSVFPPEDAVRAVGRRGSAPRTFAVGRVPTGTGVAGTTLTAGFTAPPTRASPARVWIGLTNAGVTERRLRFGPTPPFSGYRGRPEGDRDGPGLVLVPADGRSLPGPDVVPESPVDGKWIATDPVPEAENGDGTTRTLAGGETVAGEYHLLLAADATATPERAVYRFGPAPPGLTLGIGVWDPRLAVRPDSAFSASVPGVPAGDETEWFHDGDRPTFLVPDRERLSLPRDRATFRLRNLSKRPVTAGDADWDLYRRESADVSEKGDSDGGGDGWRPAATGTDDGQVDRLAVGGQRTISLGVAGEGADPPPATGDADLSVSAAGLSPGTYALRFGGATIGSPTRRVTVHGDSNTYVWTPPPSPDEDEDGDEDEEGFPNDESVVYAALVRLVTGSVPPDTR